MEKLSRSDGKLKLFALPIINEPLQLKLVHMSLFGLYVQTLSDSGAVPNLLSSNLVSELDIDVLPTTKTITVANRDSSGCVGVARELNARFDSITVKLEFLVVDEPLVDLQLAARYSKSYRPALI